MSTTIQLKLMMKDLKNNCLKSTEEFITSKLGVKDCKNLREISRNVCNGETQLHDIVLVNDGFGNIYAQDKIKLMYNRHSDR